MLNVDILFDAFHNFLLSDLMLLKGILQLFNYYYNLQLCFHVFLSFCKLQTKYKVSTCRKDGKEARPLEAGLPSHTGSPTAFAFIHCNASAEVQAT